MIGYKTCKGLDKKQQLQIARILARCDREFIPALSSRGDLMVLEPAPGCGPLGLAGYVEALSDREFVLAVADENGEEKIVGFMAYQKNYVPSLLNLDVSGKMPIYINLIAVSPDYRRRGITRSLYQVLMGQEIHYERVITLRTWSTNRPHLCLLDQMDFVETARIMNDRGPGIDTVYFKLDILAW